MAATFSETPSSDATARAEAVSRKPIPWSPTPISYPAQPWPESLEERVHRELYATCADTCERLTRQSVRAYGMAFVWWMTNQRGFDMGGGTRPEQHARISRHYRQALADGIAQAVDHKIGERIHAGTWPAPLLDPRCAGAIDPVTIKAEAVRSAQSLFSRGQYRVNLLFFATFANLERCRQRAGVQAALLGATGNLSRPPRDPAP